MKFLGKKKILIISVIDIVSHQFEPFIIIVSSLKFTLEIADTNGDNNARSFKITDKMVAIKRYERLEHVEEYVPCVVEPSFGIGRIMYALFEHR